MTTDRKKIIFAVTKGNWGGAQKYVFDLATETKKKGYEVVVVAGDGSELEALLKASGIRFIRIYNLFRDISVTSDLRSFFELLAIIRSEKPDIIHLNSSKMIGLGCVAGRLARVPKIISTFHGLALFEMRSLLQKGLIKVATLISLIASHHAIFISNKDKDSFSRWPFFGKKSSLIRLGVKPHSFLPTQDAKRFFENKLGLPPFEMDEGFWIGTVAELTSNKALLESAPFIERLPDCRWIIIGEGELEEKIRNYINAHKLHNKIFLAGRIPEASSYLKAFDSFLLPSRKEGLPYVILEAGLVSMPVIASPVGGVPEIIENEKNGLLLGKPADPDSIISAISFLAKNPEIGQRLTSELKKKIESEFNFRTMIDKTVAVYDSTR